MATVDPRIHPPREHEETLTELVESLGLFRTKQKALMFAAAIGFYRGELGTIEARGTGIRYDIFERALDDGYIEALAVAHANDLNILAPDRIGERIQIFEQYAATGLAEIAAALKRPGSPLDELIRLAQDAKVARSEDLPGIDNAILSMLENT